MLRRILEDFNEIKHYQYPSTGTPVFILTKYLLLQTYALQKMKDFLRKNACSLYELKGHALSQETLSGGLLLG